jgi:uncharacterized membrane protein
LSLQHSEPEATYDLKGSDRGCRPQRSLAAFTGQGLHHTRAETGILIFVSLLEHRVVVLADRGINEKTSRNLE